MAHQLAHRRRLFRRGEHGRAVGAGHDLAVLVPGQLFQARELRRVLGDRIVELPLALLVELHHRDAGDRLRHRVDAEQRIERHRLVGRLLADTPEVRDLAVTDQDVGHAGGVAVGDRLLHACVERVEAGLGEAERGRIGNRAARPGRIGRGRFRRLTVQMSGEGQAKGGQPELSAIVSRLHGIPPGRFDGALVYAIDSPARIAWVRARGQLS